jgi:lipoyl-dependent peroxiredoxin
MHLPYQVLIFGRRKPQTQLYPTFMLKRRATAEWTGTGQAGNGTLSAPGGVLSNTPYSFGSRFAEGAAGTNPEELLAAAHAGCFTMAVAFTLQQKGFTANALHTDAVVTLDQAGAGMGVTHVQLTLNGSAEGVSAEDFKTIAEDAKANCIISRALSVPIELEVK